MKIFLFFILFWVSHLEGSLANVLYDSQKRPSEDLLEVLEVFGISHDGSWHSIVQETQKQWLNNPNKERWEFDPIDDSQPENTYALFSNLHMTQSFWAKDLEYEYGMVLGATVQVVRQRFWFLKQQWDRGIRFKQLIVLTGDRPLSPTLENEAELIDPARSRYPFRKGWCFSGTFPTNETEMMELVFDQLDLPEAWSRLPVCFVDTPRPEGKRRPHTTDTFVQWLSMHPKPGTALIVSSQPFIGRQDSIAHHYLPPSFRIETIGEGFSLDRLKKEKRSTAILLDELARWIYEQELKNCTSALEEERAVLFG